MVLKKKRCSSRLIIFGLLITLLVSLLCMSMLGGLPTDLDINSWQARKKNFYTEAGQAYLQSVMQRDTKNNLKGFPLDDVIYKPGGFMTYFHLPKRKLGQEFTEITTANPDTGYLLAPDFTFVITYNVTELTLYKDFGPGCVCRLYLFPILPIEGPELGALTIKNLSSIFLRLEVDGTTFRYSVEQLMEGKEWPFVSPINTQHQHPTSGMGSYFPFCYQKSMSIIYEHSSSLPANLFDLTVNCTKNDLHCPVHLYSGISRIKYPADTIVQTFADEQNHESLKTSTKEAVDFLQSPGLSGPDAGEGCHLKCVNIAARDDSDILDTPKNSKGLIYAFKLRVFNSVTNKIALDWNELQLSVQLDGEAQMKDVPLGMLFGASGSLNKYASATLGRVTRHCTYDSMTRLPNRVSTGYMYFPIPYWDHARITITGSRTMKNPYTVCYELAESENYYDENLTGHLWATVTHYSDKTNGYRTLLNRQNSWGHIVGVMMNIDNLYMKMGVPVNARWGALQADPVLFVDGNKAASMMGTGLEDYFSYAHGFRMAENTSYSFVGVHHAGANKGTGPLTWHCYRFHILDPITFNTEVNFIMEGTDIKQSHLPVKEISFDDYRERLDSGLSTISHLVLYYARSESGGTVVDRIEIGNKKYCRHHNFKIMSKSKSHKQTGAVFTVSSKRYLTASNDGELYDKQGRMFYPKDVFKFYLRIFHPNKGVKIKREFYSPPKLWNDRLNISVNGHNLGEWFVPMGTLSEEFVLRQEDIVLPSSITGATSTLVVEIHAVTQIFDISYTAIVLH